MHSFFRFPLHSFCACHFELGVSCAVLLIDAVYKLVNVHPWISSILQYCFWMLVLPLLQIVLLPLLLF